MLQTLKFNGPRQINGKATFFRYESGSAGGDDESIRVRADGADLGLYWPGDSVELPDPAGLWEIVPTNPTCFGLLRVGIGRVQSARLVGNVRVIDQSADKTLSGNQFFGGSAGAADAVNQVVIGIKLSAAAQTAGKRIAVKKIILTSPTAGDFMLNGGTGTGSAVSAGTGGYNKLIGGPSTGALISAGVASPSVLLSPSEMSGAYQIGGRIALQANAPFTLDLKEPIVIAGACVLAVLGTVANRQVNAIFDWEEI